MTQGRSPDLLPAIPARLERDRRIRAQDLDRALSRCAAAARDLSASPVTPHMTRPLFGAGSIAFFMRRMLGLPVDDHQVLHWIKRGMPALRVPSHVHGNNWRWTTTLRQVVEWLRSRAMCERGDASSLRPRRRRPKSPSPRATEKNSGRQNRTRRDINPMRGKKPTKRKG